MATQKQITFIEGLCARLNLTMQEALHDSHSKHGRVTRLSTREASQLIDWLKQKVEDKVEEDEDVSGSMGFGAVDDDDGSF